MSDLNRLRDTRDLIIYALETSLKTQIDERGLDMVNQVVDFTIERSDGTSYEVQIREIPR